MKTVNKVINDPTTRERYYARVANKMIATSKKNLAAVALGKLGGSKKSKRKAKSSAANGKLGGRPKKKPVIDL